MKYLLPLILATTLFAPELLGQKAQSRWADSVVRLDINRHNYNYFQPWSRRVSANQKFGLVIGDRQIVTTANLLYNHTLLRLQKGGRGQWYTGRVTWIDYHANLALLTVDEDEFWNGLVPAKLAKVTPDSGAAELVRWNSGRFEVRNLNINRLQIMKGQLTFIDMLHLELDSEINGAGWCEAITSGDEVIGLTITQARNKCIAIPSSFIQSILDVQSEGKYRGMGFFNFFWQQSENPATLDYLKLEGNKRGVIVTQIPNLPGDNNPLKPKDILLQIDGFKIDTLGDYNDPIYGPMMLEALATRGHWAGDEIPMTVWRDGREQELTYTLPKADFDQELIPTALYDVPPEYVMAGGLVFQPMTVPYLKSWGNDWQRRAPVRLIHYKGQPPTKDRPRLVVLSTVLPDPYNIGYQSYRFLVVDKINGQRISRIEQLKEAFSDPEGDFHLVEFEQGEPVERIILDANRLGAATQRVMLRYGLSEESVINE
jgi:hypothetical protein